jgi:hypothetical protein
MIQQLLEKLLNMVNSSSNQELKNLQEEIQLSLKPQLQVQQEVQRLMV